MCIRDRTEDEPCPHAEKETDPEEPDPQVLFSFGANGHKRCLLYTSDAADERSSVDLGGRRIIKKKK